MSRAELRRLKTELRWRNRGRKRILEYLDGRWASAPEIAKNLGLNEEDARSELSTFYNCGLLVQRGEGANSPFLYTLSEKGREFLRSL